jgi:uncharacterized protein (DUF433 family)
MSGVRIPSLTPSKVQVSSPGQDDGRGFLACLHAQRVHLAPRTLAQRYVEEGLRMDEHPLIRFADGPAGRRARVVGTGKDVWEVIAAVRDNGGDAAETARYLEIPLGLVQGAITYYGAYRDEIDQWIEINEQEAAEAHAAWAAGQAAVKR